MSLLWLSTGIEGWSKRASNPPSWRKKDQKAGTIRASQDAYRIPNIALLGGRRAFFMVLCQRSIMACGHFLWISQQY
jgi:hypothetical protein